MDAESWRRVEQVLDLVLTSERAEWPRILDDTCGGDTELRREVEALLDQVSRADGFLESPPAAAAAAAVEERLGSADLETGRRLGAFRLIRPAGRGGMSRVFLAERADGLYEQQVAVKLLRADLDSEIDRGRFAAERRILASLNHPNIARLLDGGVTEEGRPYLVLEYVDGQPIDRYCEERGLGARERLSLFATVADATAYAHRNLVVHRDLKPSNILVTAAGEVKLLDFGLAKLVDPGAGAGLQPTTRTGYRWMTPEFAAPEQIRGEPVTTLTDVYQLGVVLYQLLTGRLPFADSASLHELERAVLGTEPPAPSSLRPALRGDLDAIVLQAMHKVPERRYPSVEALLDDLRRFGNRLPVRARRDTAGYRLRRFVGRHRGAVAAGAAALLALLAATGFSIEQMREARRQRDQATEDAQRATAMSEVLDVLAGEQRRAGSRTLTPAERIELTTQVVQSQYREHPWLVVDVMVALANRLEDFNELGVQRRVLGRALAIARKQKLPAQIAYATCARASSYIYDDLFDSARSDLAEARAALAAAGPPRPLLAAECYGAEARERLAEGDPAAAVPLAREGVAASERTSGLLLRLEALNLLAEALRANGRTREAAEHHLRILRELDVAGYTQSDLPIHVVGFASSTLAELGEFAATDSMMRSYLVRGEGGALVDFLHGLTQLRLGELDSADYWIARALREDRLGLVPQAWVPTALAQLRFDQGRVAEARAEVARLPEGTPTRLVNRALYGARLKRAEGDSAGAARMLDSALRIHASSDPVPAYVTQALLTAAEWRLEQGQAREADSLARLGRRVAAGDSVALGRSAYVARAEMVIARARLAMGDTAGARAAATLAATASAVGNGPANRRTVAAVALRDSLGR